MSTSAPSNRPTINDIRALASMLPPSERVFAGELSDVVSAVVNVVAHGPGLLKAAQEGGVQGVYDFYHNVQVESAKSQGVDEPTKGAPVYNDASVGQPTQQSAAPSIDYDQLAQAMVRAQAAQQAAEDAQPVPESNRPTPSVSEPTPPASDTPPTENESEGLL